MLLKINELIIKYISFSCNNNSYCCSIVIAVVSPVKAVKKKKGVLLLIGLYNIKGYLNNLVLTVLLDAVSF